MVNPNRLDDLSGLGHLAAVGLVFMTVVALNRELRARGFWTAGTARAGSPRLPRPRRARHRGRRGAAQGLNRAFVAKGLIALRRRDQSA